ncbi:hypothetical protein Y032_0222g2608 [Ancylostoma ceylanicum]|uniref:Uncharacterized protein n=1 Tax=Ancylostoma ceylanicum TaxID=53326 RepID=A0A016SIQ6_9BILA|nr:hypothetical protein Y032_0222g2608 [Ancylostoma ceylanicum]
MIRIDPRRNPTCRAPTWIDTHHLLSNRIGLRCAINTAIAIMGAMPFDRHSTLFFVVCHPSHVAKLLIRLIHVATTLAAIATIAGQVWDFL